jgi:hypothetical protein
MCDYSLMTFPNRLANESEILVTHKFSTGSIGFVSLDELCNARQVEQCAPAGLWGKLRVFFAVPAERPTIPAVCIPPGARLKARLIPERTRRTLHTQPGEELTFTQVRASWNQFRDALRTTSGQEILLQAVGVGLQIQVVSLALAEEVRPHEEFSYNLVPRR